MDILYYESAKNLNWNELMSEIRKNPDEFIQNGGWKFLEGDKEGEGEASDEIPSGDSDFDAGDFGEVT
jgi:nucleosome binding factor SPN SPT16 subunit